MLWERSLRSRVHEGSDFIAKLYVLATSFTGRGLQLSGDTGADPVCIRTAPLHFDSSCSPI